jgi:hypothetical protein
MSLGAGSSGGKGRPGRQLSDTAQLGLKPGDAFEIKLGRKQIRLIPARSSDDEE